MTIHLLLADDHAIVRDGLRRLLTAQPDMCLLGEADNGADTVGLLELPESRPADVLILDLSLPHIGGIDLVRLIRQKRPALRILVFTMQPEDRLALYLIQAGIQGYVCKDRPVSDLLAAIRAVAKGDRWLSPRLQHLVNEEDSGSQRQPHERLSPRESQVFTLLLSGKSVNEIAQNLEIGASTASNHLMRIREKLGVETTQEILIYAHRAGPAELMRAETAGTAPDRRLALRSVPFLLAGEKAGEPDDKTEPDVPEPDPGTTPAPVRRAQAPGAEDPRPPAQHKGLVIYRMEHINVLTLLP